MKARPQFSRPELKRLAEAVNRDAAWWEAYAESRKNAGLKWEKLAAKSKALWRLRDRIAGMLGGLTSAPCDGRGGEGRGEEKEKDAWRRHKISAHRRTPEDH